MKIRKATPTSACSTTPITLFVNQIHILIASVRQLADIITGTTGFIHTVSPIAGELA